jgi:cytochrome c oxidase cbb3-type subunit IV
MKKEALESIDNVAIYPMISFAIFGLFFIAAGIYVFKMKKELIERMESLPMDDQTSDK